jgi:membrane protein required for colicin V production
MLGLQPIDLVAFAILVFATLRGMGLGLIREACSIGALAAAVIAVRVWRQPLAHWLQNPSGLSVRYDFAPWLAGVLLAVGVLVAVGIFARVMRQGARAAGLGLFDRLGGAAIGAVEGAIAAGALLFVIGAVLGRSHTLLSGSRSFAMLQRAEQIAESRQLPPPDVAAAPPKR